MRRAAACVIIPPEVGHGRGIPRASARWARRSRNGSKATMCGCTCLIPTRWRWRRSCCAAQSMKQSAAAVAHAAPIVFACLPTGAVSERWRRRWRARPRCVSTSRCPPSAAPPWPHRTVAGGARHRAGGLPDQRWTERCARRHAVGDCGRPARGAGRDPPAARAHRQERVRGGRAAWPGAVDEAGEQPDQRRQHGDGVRGAGAGCEGRAGSRLDGERDQRLHRPQQRDSRQGAESGAARHVRLRREGLHDGEGHRARVAGGGGARCADVGARNSRTVVAVRGDARVGRGGHHRAIG